MTFHRTLALAILATWGNGLAAQPPAVVEPSTAPQGEVSDAERVSSDGETSSRADPCRDKWRCPDPMALASTLVAADARIAEPGAKLQKPRSKRKLVFFQDGYIVRIVKKPARRIARGFTPPPGSAPWQAQLQRPPKLLSVTARALAWDDRQACGGALIAPGWIITAAHCLTDYDANVQTAGYRVRLGVSDISNMSEGVSYRITEIHPHPAYDPVHVTSDIALIRFAPDEQSARAGPAWVQSIALDQHPPEARRLAGQRAYFYGWGLTEQERASAPLQAGAVKLEPDPKCNNSTIALCGRGIGARGVTQCHGDSGGPLVLFDQRVPTLIGIVSHNIGQAACGQNPRPGVFTRVAAFRPWVESLVGPLPPPPAQPRRQ